MSDWIACRGLSILHPDAKRFCVRRQAFRLRKTNSSRTDTANALLREVLYGDDFEKIKNREATARTGDARGW